MTEKITTEEYFAEQKTKFKREHPVHYRVAAIIAWLFKAVWFCFQLSVIILIIVLIATLMRVTIEWIIGVWF